MKYDDIKTPDDLRDFVCADIAKNTSKEMLERGLTNPGCIDFLFKSRCATTMTDVVDTSKDELLLMAKCVNDNLQTAKSEYAHAVSFIRETRMTVNREVDEMNKSITAFTSRNKEIAQMVNSLTQLRELLTDPVLKGVLK